MAENSELGCGKPEARGADSEGVQPVGNWKFEEDNPWWTTLSLAVGSQRLEGLTQRECSRWETR